MTLSNSTPSPAAPEIQALIKYFPLAIVLFDRGGNVVFSNEAFTRIFGAQTLDQPPIRELARVPAPGWKSVEIARDGGGKVTLVRVFDLGATLMMIFDDGLDGRLREEIEQLHEHIDRLERLCMTDMLTEVWNRAHFEKMIALEMERSNRLKQPVSLLVADIDNFKRVNDTHGHPVGDQLLRELVKVVQASTRATDMLFRWGGEEFTVLALATGHRAAFSLAERVRAHVAAHRFANVGHITLSIGVAEHLGVESPGVWFQRADQALYLAKDGGRDRVHVDHRGNSDVWAAEKGPSVLRLEWREAYECGEPTIDQEHRNLFDLGNEMLDASFRAEAEPEAFRAVLDRLVNHIVMHFHDEEQILAQRRYADLAAHESIHHALIKRAETLRSDVEAGHVTLGSLVDFIANTVIAHHLFKEDQKYFHLFDRDQARACAVETR
jgi:diguanylate cyclase (GGDEF)-like protein/hemerythrin-like metal-binding protein